MTPVLWNGILLKGGHDEVDMWMEGYHFGFGSPWPLRIFGGDGFDVMTLKGGGNVFHSGFEFVRD